MSENENTVSPQRQHAELLAVEVGDWAPLGGDVRLELAGRRTVLVGRNGSGKSALFEGILLGGQIADTAVVPASTVMDAKLPLYPKRFCVEIRDWQPESFFYEYTLHKKLIQREWRGARKEAISDPSNLLSRVFRGLHVVVAGVPRQTSTRSKQVVLVVETPDGADCSYLNRSEPRIGILARNLVRARFFKNEHVLEQLEELGQRIGVWKTLRVELYRRATDGGDAHPLGSVAIDGVDLGLLADGTLRMAEILWALLRADVMSHHLLLIEEPETGVHPGLLAGLLDTLDAYTVDRQVIISTHSPQVVSWAQPQELRVVTRQEGKTQVRPLSEQQVALFLKYLHDQTLGDFVYSGALDDEG